VVKKILLSLLVLIVLAVAGLAVFVATFKPAQRPASTSKIEVTPELVARGDYLTHHVLGCFDCHTDRDWSRYGGPVDGPEGAGGPCMGEEYGVPGKVCFTNITPDKETGLGNWTDGEILRAIREGVDKNGRALFPMMPYAEAYYALSDDDADAVVAYLRSLPPVSNPVPATRIDFPVSFFIKQAPKPLAGPVSAADPSDTVAYGHYLATVAGCISCHTPVDSHQQPIPGMELAGGQVLKGPWGVVASANLTPDPTGLGGRTEESFLGLFRAWQDPGIQVATPAGQNTVMPWLVHSGTSDQDLQAIWAYLQTVKPIQHKVVKRPAV
jgi:cytochrome c553